MRVFAQTKREKIVDFYGEAETRHNVMLVNLFLANPNCQVRAPPEFVEPPKERFREHWIQPVSVDAACDQVWKRFLEISLANHVILGNVPPRMVKMTAPALDALQLLSL